MEKNMETTTMGYIRTTVRIHSLIPSYPKVRFVQLLLRNWGPDEFAGFLVCPVGFVLVQYVIFLAPFGYSLASAQLPDY